VQITVQVSPQQSNVVAGTTQQFIAIVRNAGSSTGVTWQVTGPGTIDSSGNYTAPGTTSSNTVTVTATSIADPSKKASIQFTVATNALTTSQPPPPPVVSGGTATTTVQLVGVPQTSTLPFLLSCTGLPIGAGCSFSNTNSSIQGPVVTGQNPFASIKIFTSSTLSGRLPPLPPELGQRYLFFAPMLVALALLWSDRSARLRKRSYACLILVPLCIGIVCLSSCAGFSNSPKVATPAVATPRGDYQIVITATPQTTSSGFIQTQLIVPLTVN
jgi:hypothetical protein